jgi:hypothetical protein
VNTTEALVSKEDLELGNPYHLN